MKFSLRAVAVFVACMFLSSPAWAQPTPALSVSPTSLSYSGTVGQSITPQTVQVSKVGGGKLTWNITAVSSWLTVSPLSGTNNGTLTVSVPTVDLSAGTYQGGFTIESNGGTETVQVTLTLSDPEPPPPPPDPDPPPPDPDPADPDPSWVIVDPGVSVQALVDAHPEGTTFYLTAGVHRMQRIRPKTENAFFGEPGAILSGARLLTDFSREGIYWVASGQTQQGMQHGACLAEAPRCGHPENLYFDSVPLRHVATLADVAPGRWFFDYDADKIYFADDPAGRTVETSVTTMAFEPSAANVTIAGLVIEKYANPAQHGAVHGDGSSGWVVRDNEIRLNHGVGVRIHHGMQVLNNRVNTNGQLGMGGIGDDVLVQGNEIAHNNFAGFRTGWEAGGTKFVRTHRLIVRDNFVHHNKGFGLWTDGHNLDTLYEYNIVEDNDRSGIFHEISYAAVIRHNEVRRNGFWFSVWLWGAGILIANSPNVEIHDNLVEHNADGIGAIHQDRGSGIYGPFDLENLLVHNNTVIMATGETGLAQDVGDMSVFESRNNRFETNTYYLGSNTRYFEWMNGLRTAEEWRGFGNDVDGTFLPLEQ